MDTRPGSDMLTCANCGQTVERSARFCGFCGREMESRRLVTPPVLTPQDDPRSVAFRVRDTSYLIPTRRVLLLTLASHGLYFFYWFYLTWKHYRDHTGEEVYPLWHALCLIVPIYSLFRIHAHMRSFRSLMEATGAATTINPGMTVLTILATWVLDLAAVQLNGGWAGSAPPYSWGPLVGLALTILSISILGGVITHIQGNLNYYWENVKGSPLAPAGIGAWEVVLTMVGALTWIATISLLTGVVEPASALLGQ